MAAKLDLRRGPKVGDAASLWNFTPSPGWTKEEVFILKLCLQKYGIGRWVQILDTGLLPGKLIQQLNGQTQRLLGQQSLAAYTGLQVDIDRIRAENEAKTDVERKSGLIIWSGPNPTKAMKDAWRKEAQQKYGLSKEQISEVEAQLAEVHTLAADQTAPGAALMGGVGALTMDIMDTPVQDVSTQHKLTLLEMLHRNLHQALQMLQQHQIVLAIPEDFAGFRAQRQLAGDAPPPETSVLAEVPVPTDNSPAVTDAAEPAKPTTARKRKPQATSTGRGKGARRPKKQAYVDSDEDEDMQHVDEEEAEEQGRGGAAGGRIAAKALAASGLVDELAGMGFARSKAQDALEMCEGDMQAAIEWLVANCV